MLCVALLLLSGERKVEIKLDPMLNLSLGEGVKGFPEYAIFPNLGRSLCTGGGLVKLLIRRSRVASVSPYQRLTGYGRFLFIKQIYFTALPRTGDGEVCLSVKFRRVL